VINQNIEFIRAYFLSFDEEEQEKIFSSLSDEQKDIIVEAGVVFLSNGGVETISGNSSLIEHKRELKEVQLEYFIGLADILAVGGTNEVIEKLRRSKNLLFEEVLAEFKDNTSFENDLLAGIRSIERKDLKQDLSLLDKEEGDLGIPDEEVKYAISKIERKALKRKLQEIEDSFVENDVQHATVFSGEMEASVLSKSTVNTSRIRFWSYAVAAAVLIFVVGTGLYYFSQVSYQSASMAKNTKRELPSLPNLIRAQEITQSVWQDESINGFGKKTDSIKIKIIGVSAQIDTLQKILEKVSIESNPDYKPLNYAIISQIDSLQALINTYTFFGDGKTLFLTLAKKINDIRVYVLEDKNGSNFYIRLQEQFFQISENARPYKLYPITNPIIIDELKKIEFLNE